MDAEKLRGMAVVSVAEGSKLGYVDEVLFDTAALQVIALRVRGDHQAFVIPFEYMQSIGADAVTVEGSQVTQVAGKEGPFSGSPTLASLKRLKVVDEAGTLLGTVERVEIDRTGGRIVGVTAHKGGVFGLGGTSATIEAGAIRSVGNELMTVARPAAETPEARDNDPATA